MKIDTEHIIVTKISIQTILNDMEELYCQMDEISLDSALQDAIRSGYLPDSYYDMMKYVFPEKYKALDLSFV